ncbi:MAG: hypothetical protein RJB13_387 [Pseudomonadota bacterium]
MRGTILILFTAPYVTAGCLIQTTEMGSQQKTWQNNTNMIGLPVEGTITSVGAAEAEFTPLQPTSLAGFGSISRRLFPPVFSPDASIGYCRKYQKIENPPRIKAAVINLKTKSESTPSKVFFLSLDIVAVTADLSIKILDKMNESFGSGSAHLHNSFITATHTHSAPSGLTESPLWSSFICDSFNESMTGNYLNKVQLIFEQADAAAVPVNEVEISHHIANRFLKSRNKNMEADTEVSVLSFTNENRESPLAFLEIAVHPTTFGTQSLILSADLVTPLEKSFETELGISNVFLMQTHVGNMESLRNGYEVNGWAQALAQEFKSKSVSQSTEGLQLKTRAGFISLPKASINWKGCAAQAAQYFVSLPLLDQLPAVAPAAQMSLANQTRYFLPGEWTTIAAKKAIERFSADTVAKVNAKVFSLAFDYTGYHVDKDDYDETGIESCSSLYGRDSLERVIETTNKIFKTDELR